jgi:cytochrome P450
VPINQKQALNDDVLPDGTPIKKGDVVIWSSYSVGRNKDIWGPDAKEFKPERWFTENGDIRRESQGKWPAFHAGRKYFVVDGDPFLILTPYPSSLP